MGETTLRGLRKVRMVTERIGHDILWVRRADSTNNLAWREAEQNCHDGRVVLAEEQTAGRGRLGRSWVCPPGKGILVSIVLRPERPMDASPYLTVCGALAVRDVAADAVQVRLGAFDLVVAPSMDASALCAQIDARLSRP